MSLLILDGKTIHKALSMGEAIKLMAIANFLLKIAKNKQLGINIPLL